MERGAARKVNLYGRGQGFHVDEYGNAVLLHSAYDGDSSGAGHSYKPYYFYFDGGGFVEYGAIEITREQLLECDGAEDILKEAETDGWTLDNILYRGCGMVHLNLRTPFVGYMTRDDSEVYGNRYVTLRLEGNRLTRIDEGMGFYVPAFTRPLNRPPEIAAAYPSGWKQPALP